MRILFAVDHLGYGGGVWHGCTTYLTNVLPRLRARGHVVALCVMRSPHASAKMLVDAGVNVKFLDTARFDVRAVSQMLEMVHEFQPDVVHAHQREASMTARLTRLSKKAPVVALHIHDEWPVPLVERFINHTLLPQPDVAFCVCKTVADVVQRWHGVERRRQKILLNAIDVASVRPSSADARARLRHEWGLPQDAPIIASTSRFGPEKRLLDLVRMIPSIVKRVPDARFVLAGDGQERQAAIKLAHKLRVDSLTRFLGHRTDIADVVTACDVTALLCLKEACSYALIESQVLGRPVVAYAAGGNPEVVMHERTGLLAANDADFADSLVRILSDRELRGRLSKAAVAEADRFDVRHHVAKLEETYASASAGKHGGAALTPRASHP
jgi:glycosyltransferase involved in cell wall biosynthesis